jgi:uncharacterized protein (DUF1499 family)
MTIRRYEPPTIFAPWSLRLVSLAAQLLVVTAVLHRFAALQTAVAMNLLVVGFAAAGLAGLGGIAALVQIWRHGLAGTAAAAGAVLLGGALLFIPAYYVPLVLHGNGGFDASSDAGHPPPYVALAKVRASAGIDPATTAVTTTASGDPLEPILTARPPGDVFDLTNDILRQLDLNIVAEQAPGFGADDGSIEATDRTLVLGLHDDISIRIGSRQGQTRVDVRSAARYPRLDLGRNAERVKMILRKLRASIEANVQPDLTTEAAVKPSAGTAGSATVLRRKKRAPSPRGAPDAPAPTTERP